MANEVGLLGHDLRDEESLSASKRVVSFAREASLVSQLGEEKKKFPVTLCESFGLDEIFSMNVWRASAGELLGTAILVFMLDAIVISTYEDGVRTLPNLIPSILIAITIAILLLATFPVSGGHLNPVISFSACLVGVISISRAAVYMTAQCIGATLGALAVKSVITSKIDSDFSLGGCTITVISPGPGGQPITIGIDTAQAFWLEIICSFVFLFASIWMAYDSRQAKNLGPVKVFSIIGIVIGLLVFVSTTVTTKKGYAGAGMNPARCLGAAIVRGGHLWDGHWVFWAGPFIACVLFYLYTLIIPPEHFYSDGMKYDFFTVVKGSIGLIVHEIRKKGH
ncbi:hypothetical protein Leryth_017000 [Lithospermum erythrorhizon]|uniref:Uncharacterized protein n=1 Tax=Lithospermum erythrorhizon TaxID=34254 RepID=A0AAV3RE45_LITER|nr:hypothetical protein Leryth_017000 [Lithospermum erythrorhizon]